MSKVLAAIAADTQRWLYVGYAMAMQWLCAGYLTSYLTGTCLTDCHNLTGCHLTACNNLTRTADTLPANLVDQLQSALKSFDALLHRKSCEIRKSLDSV